MADDIVRAVEEGRADLGISWDRTDTRRLKTVPYRNDHLVVIAHREHELAHRKCVAFDIGVKNCDSACRIAAAGLAIALVPREVCDPLIKGLGLKAIALSDD